MGCFRKQPESKVYKLTPAGRKQLVEERSNWDRISTAVNLVLRTTRFQAFIAMNWLPALRRRFRALFQKEKLDARMDDEMLSHIEMQTQENIEAGMKTAGGALRGVAAVRLGRINQGNLSRTARGRLD
jgi:DNA-binding PadR family transcriptional regulator